MRQRQKSRSKVELPLGIWAQVFRNLCDPRDIFTVAQVCKSWSHEVLSNLADPLWRNVWDSRSAVPSDYIDTQFPFCRVEGGWREQVRSSCRLTAQGVEPETTIYLPPRYSIDGNGLPVTDDDVDMIPSRIDIEETLGRATCVHTFANDVVVGFERGVGILCFCSAKTQKRLRAVKLGRSMSAPSRKKAVFFYDDNPTLGGIALFSKKPVGSSGQVLAATTSKLIVLLDIDRSRHSLRRPLRWRSLDNYELEDGALVELTVSVCGTLALAGFDTGRVRIISTGENGGLRHILSMRESADLVACSGRWVVAACFMQPIGCVVWDARDGRALYRFDQTSVSWEEVTQLAGLAPTGDEDVFALWNGKHELRLLDARRGSFLPPVSVRARISRGVRRTVADEGELGAASAHVGRGRMVLAVDSGRAVLSSSNRVVVAELPNLGGQIRPKSRRPSYYAQLQLDGARRSLVALSTDERAVVTADANAFGGLSTWVAGRTALAATPTLRVWDAVSGKLCREMRLPSPASDLSVSANIVAAVSLKVGQVVVNKF